jgi:hypothetical protein
MSVRNMLVGAGGARKPDAPTSVSASYSSGTQASVSFTAPADNGSAITSYTVTSSPGSITASGSSSPITITGLSTGTTYTFTVTATNAVGTSDASSPSNSITTQQPPGSQTYNTANFAGEVFQPAGYSTVTLELWGSGAETNRSSGSGSKTTKNNVPVSGLYVYIPQSYRLGNSTLGGYSGGPFGPASTGPYRGGYGGSATVAVRSGTYYVAAGGGGGNGRSNGNYYASEGTVLWGPPSGTNGGTGQDGGCYYGGGGGGGGSTGGWGGARNQGGSAGVSQNYDSLTTDGGAGRGTTGYAKITWS